MDEAAKNVFEVSEKLEKIKKVIRDNKGTYVEIDPLIVNCLYDLLVIISNSNVENVMNKISICSNLVRDKQHLSEICLYIGFFVSNLLEECPLRDKIGTVYYKISSEMGNIHAMHNLGRYYCNNVGKFDTSIKYYERSLEYGYLNHGTVHSNIAYCYYKKGNYDVAIKCYEQADNYGKGSIVKYCHLAACYYEKGDYDAAIKYYKKDLLLCRPKHQNVLCHNIGICYFEKKDYDNAIKYYEEALNSGHSDKVGLYGSLACCCYLRADYDKSMEYYEKVLQLLSGNVSVIHGNIGRIYLIKNNYPDALKYFKLAYESGNYAVVGDIGNTYLKMKNYDKATKYFKKSVELFTNGLITEYIIYNGYENIFLNNKNYDDLVVFYVVKKDVIKIMDQLIKIKFEQIQISTIVNALIYFNDNEEENNALHTFVRNVARHKTKLLKKHFKYAINSSGYDQAEEDFYNHIPKNVAIPILSSEQ